MATAKLLVFNPLPDFEGSSYFIKLDPPYPDTLKREHIYVIAMVTKGTVYVVPANPDGTVKVLFDLHTTHTRSGSPLTTAMRDMGYDLNYPEA